MYKIIKDNNNNEKKLILITKKLDKINSKFVEMLKRNNIKNINLTSFGNSIATGFAINDDIYPLLKRNKNLEEQLTNSDINNIYRSYARAQDNNDEHLLDWLVNNIKESEINEFVHIDFDKQNVNSMDSRTIKKEDVEKLYPLKPKNDIGLLDLVKQSENSLANIIVYNGATGSFLDNFTRHGRHLNLHGFYRDFKSMEAVLKNIYLTNSNTQVYVCGIPNLTKLNVVGFLNHEIKKICKKYPNCTYVKSVPQNFIYKKDGKIIVDIHYNKEEYLDLNCNIIESITENYEQVKAKVEMDTILKKYNAELFKKGNNAKTDDNKITDEIANLIEKYKQKLTSKQLKNIVNYYKEKYPYDYYYTPRKTIIEVAKSNAKKS